MAATAPPAASSPSTAGFRLPAGPARKSVLAVVIGLVLVAVAVWLIHRQTGPQTRASTGAQNSGGPPQTAPVIHFEPRPPLEGQHDDEVCDVAFSPVSDLLASANCGSRNAAAINLWTVPGGDFVRAVSQPDVTKIAFSEDGKLLAAGGGMFNNQKYEVAVYDTNTWSKMASFRDDRPRGIAIASDGALAVVFDWGLKLYSPPDWHMRSELGKYCTFDSGEFSRDGQFLATLVSNCQGPSQKEDPASDKVIRVWDPATSTVRYTVPMEPQGALQTGYEFYREHEPKAIAVSPGGAYLAVATKGSTIILDPKTGQLLKTLNILRGETPAKAYLLSRAMTFSPDGSLLAENDLGYHHDSRIMLWQVAGWKPLADIPTADQISAISFSRDGKWLAAAATKKIYLWERMP